jgi:mono/diheme cytochrome c family protein
MGDRLGNARARRTTTLLVTAALAATVALLAACGGGSRSTTTTRSASNVAITQVASDRWTFARERFRETCAGCHTLADARAHGRRFNLDMSGPINTQLARHAIEQGEPGMPAWKGVLSRREFEELVAYVTSVSKNEGDNGREDGWHWQIKLRNDGEGPPSTWR